MLFSAAVSALLAGTAAAVAVPAMHNSGLEARDYTACSGLYSEAECCATDVLGVADLDCGTPPSTPANATDFSDICSAIGQRARCCVLPLLDLGVLCDTPSGVTD
ncbi:Cerato-ulmin hydrophobin family [Xylariaceae sp. FL0804]|nr:Cerato-ulmin hydrophobin family [Xylariaceae sp. FL0804]